MSDIFNQKLFPWLQNRRCLVTGGAGFIGSHIVEKLVHLGARVVVLDDLSTGQSDNLKGFDVELKQGSITSAETVAECMSGIDYVFHLAAIPAVPRSIERPLDTAWVNIWGTQLILEEARKAKVKRVIYSSSSSAYGATPGELPRGEELPPRPISPYAAQKLTGEYLGAAYALTQGLEAVSLRYFNIFGPRQNPKSAYAAVVPKFIKAALNNESITVFGDGTQKRDFTFVDNAVYANLLATRPDFKPQGEVTNIGCGSSYSLNDLIAHIEKLVEHPLKVEYAAPRTGDVFFSQANIQRARSLFGFEPIVKFEEGLKRVYSYLKN